MLKILKEIANNTIKYPNNFRGGLTAAKNEPRNRGTAVPQNRAAALGARGRACRGGGPAGPPAPARRAPPLFQRHARAGVRFRAAAARGGWGGGTGNAELPIWGSSTTSSAEEGAKNTIIVIAREIRHGIM